MKWGGFLLVMGAFVLWLNFAPIPVNTHLVQSGTLVSEVMGTGTLEARVSTTVSPKISGRIDRVLADQESKDSLWPFGKKIQKNPKTAFGFAGFWDFREGDKQNRLQLVDDLRGYAGRSSGIEGLWRDKF